MVNDSPTLAGSRRRVGKPTAAARRDRLTGRERAAANMAKELAVAMERAVPGAVHALRLDTFKGHQMVDIIFNRDRHGGGRAADDRGGDADAGAPAQEDAPRSGRRHSAAAATAASGSAPARRPTPPAFTGERQAPQPAQQQAMEAPAPSEEPPLCTLFGEAELPAPDASASGADGAARATVAEAMQESVPPGPAFCWPPPPLPRGQPPGSRGQRWAALLSTPVRVSLQ